jgi:hypothetical protein
VSFAADVSWDGLDAALAISLAPAAAAALRDNLAAPAPAGYLAFREQSGVHLDWSVDIAWLEGLRAVLACPLLAEPILDPLAAATGGPGARSYHLAGERLDIENLDGRLAVHLGLRDRSGIARQLDSIPGRSWLERKRVIAGVEVRELGGLPGVPPLAYRLTDEVFTAAVGEGLMAHLLGGEQPGEQGGEVELGAFSIHPGRLPGLAGIIEAGLRLVSSPDARAVARAIAGRLAGYEHARLRLTLAEDTLSLTAGLRRRN